MRTGNKRDGPFRPCRAGDGDANGLITVTRQRWTERISTRTCTPHDHTLPTNRTHLRNPGHRAEGAGRPARGQTPEGRHRRLGRRRHSLVTPSTCPLLTGAELGGGAGRADQGWAGLWGERHHVPLELDPRGRLHPAVPAALGGQATPNSPTRRILSLAQLPGDERPHPAFLCTVTVFTEGGC